MDIATTAGAQQLSHDHSWRFWFTLPLYPYGRRRTICQEVVEGEIWTFDQIQGIFYVVVPIRMTIAKLAAGGLLVYAPIAPTPECIRLVKELVAEHGDVQYVVLPTTSGIEHKAFVGPFARCFPSAQIFVAPNQWSFPLNLPLSWLGLPGKRTHVLPTDSKQAPFADEFDYAMLGAIELGPGSFAEVAFFHRRSQTLLVTDSVLSIPAEPPAIAQLDPYPLLFHAKDNAFDAIEDTPANRRKGWQRISLFTFYIRPSALEIRLVHAFEEAFRISGRRAKPGQRPSRQSYFGWFPFRWKENWQQSFEALRGGGRLLVAPVLQTLILNRAPQETIDWAEKVASWDFQQIVPCHLDAPIAATPQQFRQAFAFLQRSPTADGYSLPEADFQFLKQLEKILHKIGVVPPAKEKV